MSIASILAIQGCKEKLPTVLPTGTPDLRYELVEDLENHTFSLTLSADSVGDASVTFYLIDCGDTIMRESGQSVIFNGIAPLDDGYDVVMRVERPDTIISRHVTGFILTPEPVEKMTAEELQELINAKDKSIKRGTNDRLAQSVPLTLNDALRTPKKLSEVIDCIEFGEWKSVIVTDVDYDDNNLITSVTLKPVGEKPLAEPVEDEEEIFEIYDD